MNVPIACPRHAPRGRGSHSMARSIAYLMVVLLVAGGVNARSELDLATAFESPAGDRDHDSIAHIARADGVSALAMEPRAPFIVNSEDDTVDASVGDGCCDVRSGHDGDCEGAVCTLRAAVQEANARVGPDTVELSAGTYKLTIPGVLENRSASGDIDVLEALTIQGADASRTVVDGSFLDRVFHVGDALALSDLTIRNGDTSSHGGGIRFDSSRTLTLRRVVVAHNKSCQRGGGIFNNHGTLDIEDSTISDNESSQGGGIDNGLGQLTIRNSTLSGNRVRTSDEPAPGIALAGGTIVNSTIDSTVSGRCNDGSDPLLARYPDCVNQEDPGRLLLYVRNSILLTCKGRVVSEGNNIMMESPQRLRCTFIGQSSDRIGGEQPLDPRLGPLQDNGGTTPTRALRPGSLAINTVSDSQCPATDQRGEPRPQGAACDIGAYEACSCEGEPDGMSCDSGEGCHYCTDGICAAADPTHCDDGDTATVDRCDAGVGCVSEPRPVWPSTCSNSTSCGNGAPEAPTEECDEGPENGTDTLCCDSNCQLRPGGEICRPASGVCDVAEACDGVDPVCPEDAFASRETVCRVAAGACDEAETCSGESKSCPEDEPFRGVKVCGAEVGQCEDERARCDGVHMSCPMNHAKADGSGCALPGCKHPVCLDGTCTCRDGLCGNGVIDDFEECDLDQRNSDSENAEVCCSTQCKFQAGLRCFVSQDTCVETSICRDHEASCPDAVPAGRNKSCVREPCTFNSSCEDGTCQGGIQVCAVEARQRASRGVPKIQVRCADVNGKQPQSARCESKGSLSLESLLSPVGNLLIAPQGQAATQATVSLKCSRAADGVRGACGHEITREVFICTATQKLVGGQFKACKSTSCGKSLNKLATNCPQAMKGGVLNSKVVTRITGLIVGGVSQDTTVTKACNGRGVCR